MLKEVFLKLSDGRMMPLEELVVDYERLLREENARKAIISKPKDDNAIIKQELKVGEWFLIDRYVIEENMGKIRRLCNEAGKVGEQYMRRFEKSNGIAYTQPEKYSRIIKTFIFKREWECIDPFYMYEFMCTKIGDGPCDEVICDLELQMRICNGESTNDLFKKRDKLPRVRTIRFRDGDVGYFGGSNRNDCLCYPPAHLQREKLEPYQDDYFGTAYAFKRELS